MEILAPVKDFVSLKLAIISQADAVYFAGPGFGARKNADNTIETSIEMIELAKLYDVKSYITVNTLIFETEQSEVLAMLDKLYLAGADGFIIQDFGLFTICKLRYPNIELHCSTQMHIHNIEAGKLFKNLGAKRIVMPRELNFDEIKNFKENVDIDVEAFAHGALCTSYSGQCLLSSHLTDTSGNRGRCNQHCRMKWNVVEDDQVISEFDYNLSLKDLCTINQLDAYKKAKIDSLKIEGRLKRYEYVGVVVDIYKKYLNLLDNHKYNVVNKSDIENLQLIYNRRFTTGLITNNEKSLIANPERQNHHGLRIGKIAKIVGESVFIKTDYPIHVNDNLRFVLDGFEDGIRVTHVDFDHNHTIIQCSKELSVNALVFKTVDIKQLENEKAKLNSTLPKQKIPLSLTLLTDNNSFAEFTFNNEKHIITSNFVAEHSYEATNKDRVLQQICKTGNTPFEFIIDELYIEDGFKVKISELNEFRRLITDELTKLKSSVDRQINDVCEITLTNENKISLPSAVIEIKTFDQYLAIKDSLVSTIYVNNLDILSQLEDATQEIIPVLPRVIHESEFASLVAKVKNYPTIVVSEYGMLNYFKDEKNIILNHTLYATNTWAKNAFYNIGANYICNSFETDFDLDEYFLYGKKPLMIMQHCPITGNEYHCKNCNLCEQKNYHLVNDKNFTMDLIKETPNTISAYANKPINLINSVEKIHNFNTFRISFTNEDKETTEKILEVTNAKILQTLS